jgi:uncharacterized protein (DUF433 family)
MPPPYPTRRLLPRKVNQQAYNSEMSSTQISWLTCPEVERTPGKVSGTWVFRGTRIPVRALFENLRDGASIEEFLKWFPGVRRNQVQAVIDHELATLSLAVA